VYSAVAQTKLTERAIREATEVLVSQGRDVTTSAILAGLNAEGIKAKASDIHASAAWKELVANEKGKTEQNATSAPRPKKTSKADTLRPQTNPTAKKEKPVAKTEQKKPNFPSKTCPKCSKPIHVRFHKHEACGWVVAQPTPTPSATTARKPGRPKKAALPSGGISLDDIRAVKQLADRIGADKVRELAVVLTK
jgi:hypothetical protein